MVEFFAMLILTLIGAACIANCVFAFCIHDEIKDFEKRLNKVFRDYVFDMEVEDK